MCYNVLYVDDVTAYVIGWQKELTDIAKAFLQETMFMNGTFEGKGVYYFHTGGKKKGIWKNGKYLRRF